VLHLLVDVIELSRQIFELTLLLLDELTAYNLSHLNLAEILFIIWSVGFALDEFASLYENGSSVYFYGAFNVLDSLYCLIFFVYLGIRVNSLVGGGSVDLESSQLAFDVLSLAGCVLAPRLMVSLIPDHVVVMALGRMARQFA
jgi:predicted signal transduction protein with EAL and GGDEF domain